MGRSISRAARSTRSLSRSSRDPASASKEAPIFASLADDKSAVSWGSGSWGAHAWGCSSRGAGYAGLASFRRQAPGPARAPTGGAEDAAKAGARKVRGMIFSRISAALEGRGDSITTDEANRLADAARVSASPGDGRKSSVASNAEADGRRTVAAVSCAGASCRGASRGGARRAMKFFSAKSRNFSVGVRGKTGAGAGAGWGARAAATSASATDAGGETSGVSRPRGDGRGSEKRLPAPFGRAAGAPAVSDVRRHDFLRHDSLRHSLRPGRRARAAAQGQHVAVGDHPANRGQDVLHRRSVRLLLGAQSVAKDGALVAVMTLDARI